MASARPLLILLSFVVPLATCSATKAQIVISSSRIMPAGAVIQATTPSPAGGPTTATPDGAPAENPVAEPESPEDILMKQLLAAKFDRTAQSVLKAWSYREEPAAKSSAKDKKKKSSETSATIASAYEAVVILNFEKDCKLKPKDIVTLKRGDKAVSKTQILSVDGKTVVTKLSKPSKKKPSLKRKPRMNRKKKRNRLLKAI